MSGGRPAVDKVAKILGMSARTMQRRRGRAGHDVPGRARRHPTAIGAAAAREHGSRHRRGRVLVGLRGGQFVHSGLFVMGRLDTFEMARTRDRSARAAKGASLSKDL